MAEQKNASVKRRTLTSLIIEPFKQIKFGLYMLGITIAFLVVSAILFVNSFLEQYRHVLSIFNVVDPNLRWDFITDEIFYTNLVRLLVCFVIFMFVLFFTIFRLTHRYYGPLVAIRRFLAELKNGNYSARVTVRKKDELQDLVETLNELAVELEKKHGKKEAP
ncbi:MAG: hypothetical protein HYW48_10685 [Deltaproteobacteria bacterium]|nr:hypothetical protein [Deltaproteobacteria bacterium]